MDKETRKMVMGVGIFILILAGGYLVISAATGFSLSFSSVVSESMQHDNERSEIGVIDTGDIVVVVDPSAKDITSYVMGEQTGYKSFGEYGSVIIYKRGETQNPVIHRAIVWLDYDDNTKMWSSKELVNYSGWYCIYSGDSSNHRSNNPNAIRGTLYFEDIAGKKVSINLDNISNKYSGYLTMGDNPITNTHFDQNSGIVNHLISMDDIKSVAVLEIPWLGVPKLFFKENNNLECVPNSLPSLIMVIIVIFSLLLIIDAFSIFRYQNDTEKELNSIKNWKK